MDGGAAGDVRVYRLSGARTAGGYDEAVAVATLQGNINRGRPVLYVESVANARPQYWRSVLSTNGGWLTGRPCATISDLDGLMQLAGSNAAKQVVIWDTKVPATVNVATTIAGVEDGVVLSPDLAAAHPSHWGLPVTDLRGQFTGSGTVNFEGVSFPSSGSAKNDAYRWAMRKYLNTGLCSKKFICYYEDACDARKANGQVDYAVVRDWAVKHRAFVYDLSPWGDEAPMDDLRQPLGTDLATYTNMLGMLLDQTAGANMTELCGFFSFSKYSNATDAKRKHGDVATEWETVRLITPYNCYQNTLAGGCYNQSFHSQAPVRFPMKSHRPAKTKPLESKTYICLFMADYDSALTIYDILPDKWSDRQRGSMPLLWGVNPNLMDTYPDLLEHYYRTATTNDYFAADASAAGYLNPNFVQEQYLPLFVRHNQHYYSNLDMSISPMVLDRDSPASAVKDAFAQFSPDGFSFITFAPDGVSSGIPEGETAPVANVWKSMPILNRMTSAGGSPLVESFFAATHPQAATCPTFYIFRNVWEPVSQVVSNFHQLQANRRDLNIEFLDPYNFFRLIRESAQAPAKDVSNRLYLATSGVMRHSVGRADGAGGWRANRVQDTNPGWLLYGPYDAHIPDGEKTAAFRLKINDITAPDAQVAVIDILAGANAVASANIRHKQFMAANQYQDFILPFSVRPGSPIEFRVFWNANSEFTVESVKVTPAPRAFGNLQAK